MTKYGRWRSPKFLIGESYGGLRAAGLTGYLRERYNMVLNGVIMISPALNFETFAFAFGNDLPYILFVPGYTAAAWYHKALPGDLQALSLEEVVKQATAFATNEYTLAMMKGQSLGDEERNAVAEKLARYTGLSKEYVLQAKLRISMQRFAKELLRKKSRVVGRYDSRYKGIDDDDAGETPDYDASAAAVFGPFTSAINDYLHNDLKVEDEHVYEILTDKVQPWSFGRYTSRYPGRDEYAPRVDVGQSVLEAVCGKRLLRPGHAAGDGEVQRRAHAVAAGAAEEHRPQVLRRRPHDVRLRAVDGEAAEGFGRVLRIGAQARKANRQKKDK